MTERKVSSERVSGERLDGWLIHKAGRGWYRPAAQGYTNDPMQAGRYSHEEALSYSHPNGWDGPRDGITVKHESELLALRSSVKTEIRIKPLEWERVTESPVFHGDETKRFWKAANPSGGSSWVNVHTEDFEGEASWGGKKYPNSAAAMNAVEDHLRACILSAIEAPAAEGEAVAGSDNAAIEIADAVISWMVKHDLLDADQEYRDDDIIAVLDDLALPAAASEVTDDMVQKAWEAYDAKSGYSKPERFRAALTAAISRIVAQPALPPVDGLEVVAWKVSATDRLDQFFEIEGEADQWANSPGVLDSVVSGLVTLSQASSVIAGLKAEIADLRDEWQAEYDARLAANTARRAAEARISSLEEENKRLRTALGPFSKMAQCTDHTDTRDGEVVMRLKNPDARARVELTRSDFRSARQALEDHNG